MMSMTQVVSEMEERIRTADRISLFLDFDGTLVPIAADPASPRLDSRAHETLRMLLVRESLVTTILSGRAVEDLYGRIQLPGFIYAGNHGLEIFGRDLRFVEPVAAGRSKQLEKLCDELAADLRPFAGAQVEFKGLTASIHYRRAADEDFPAIKRAVHSAVASTGDLFRLNCGRKVFEVMPHINWHKGAAVRCINGQLTAGNVSSTFLFSAFFGGDLNGQEGRRPPPGASTVNTVPPPTGPAPLLLRC